VSKAIEQGPLNPVHHKFWAPGEGITDFAEVEYDSAYPDWLPDPDVHNGLVGNISFALDHGDHDNDDEELMLDDGTMVSAFTVDTEDEVSKRARIKAAEKVDAAEIAAAAAAKNKNKKSASRKTLTERRQAKDEAESASMMVPKELRTNNPDLWSAVSRKTYYEIKRSALTLEWNKRWTGEKTIIAGGEASVEDSYPYELRAARTEAKHLATMRAHGLRDLINAVADEDKKERQRKEDLAEVISRNGPDRSRKTKELKQKHSVERHNSRTYLRTLQHDNEVALAHRLSKNGYLW
jgi:hypothetical protein